MSNRYITIGNREVKIKKTAHGDYLSLTDLAKLVHEKSGKVINNWIKSVRALEYLHAWEMKNNPNYSEEAYRELRMQAGSATFFLSTKQWLEATGGIGIESTRGVGGGTYAHNLIALEFCATLSAEFRLSVFHEYLELKSNENLKWLKTNEFYLKKIEDNALNVYRLSKDLRALGEEE